jgi:hypothetical protein
MEHMRDGKLKYIKSFGVSVDGIRYEHRVQETTQVEKQAAIAWAETRDLPTEKFK